MHKFSYTIVVLTFNRNPRLAQLLEELARLSCDGASPVTHQFEVIVVDNASSEPAAQVTQHHPSVTLIRSPENLGAAGRNLGFAAARGEVIVCLDDDVGGLTSTAFDYLDEKFTDSSIAAVNFKVLEQGTLRLVNWVHHRASEQYQDQSFDTYEITEGAVAFRKSVLDRVGGYAASFFLSHEGPDLAFRMMNAGFRVVYTPEIAVIHSFAPEGRTSWRNYYYDTRNTLWLAARNLPATYGLLAVARQIAAMFFYSVRDGYLRWWTKGVWDGLKGFRLALRDRQRLNGQAMARIRDIDRARPGIWYLIRRRMLQHDFKL
jgi:GT2 family glycosyltransferase